MKEQEYGPLMSPWAYIGYSLLFCIPLVGLICCIVFAFNNEQLNRRNYCRSILITMIIAVVIALFAYFVLGVGVASYGSRMRYY